jgi:hypothetical protein
MWLVVWVLFCSEADAREPLLIAFVVWSASIIVAEVISVLLAMRPDVWKISCVEVFDFSELFVIVEMFDTVSAVLPELKVEISFPRDVVSEEILGVNWAEWSDTFIPIVVGVVGVLVDGDTSWERGTVVPVKY